MAIAKEIRFLNTGRTDQAGRGVKSGSNAEGSGLGLFDINQHIEQIAPRPPPRRNIHILEKSESLHPARLCSMLVALNLLCSAIRNSRRITLSRVLVLPAISIRSI